LILVLTETRFPKLRGLIDAARILLKKVMPDPAGRYGVLCVCPCT